MSLSLESLTNKQLAILGFGVNNRALTKWLVQHNLSVTVCDEQEQVKADAEQHDMALAKAINWQLGTAAFSGLDKFDYLFRTPGMRPDHPAIVEAQSRGGAILTSQTELFFALSPATIIGITGTKGKGTTASLLFSMLKEGIPATKFSQVYLAGNIGTDPFEFLDQLKSTDLVILELSSFQLFLARIKPKVAIVLSLSSDHLDYHQNIEEYVAAKSYLVRNQSKHDLAILHHESKYLKQFQALTQAEIYTFSRQQRVERGAYLADWQGQPAIMITGEEEPLLLAADLNLPGEHNLENAAAAALTAYLLGVQRSQISKAAAAFAGLPHRLQTIYKANNIIFVDDSIATNPAATIAAIQAFATKPIHLIAGGVSKGQTYEQLGQVIDRNCSSLTLIGQNTPELAKTVRQLQPFLADNMEEAVRNVMTIAQPNEVVLLSPASASFDLYENYAARGDDFATRVKHNQPSTIHH